MVAIAHACTRTKALTNCIHNRIWWGRWHPFTNSPHKLISCMLSESDFTQNDDRGTLEREPVWLGGKALGYCRGIRVWICLLLFPSLFKGCGKRTLFSDAAYPQKNDKSKMAFAATQLSTKSRRWKQCSERLSASPSARLSVTTSISTTPPPPLPPPKNKNNLVSNKYQYFYYIYPPPHPTPQKTTTKHTHTNKNPPHTQEQINKKTRNNLGVKQTILSSY